MSLAAIAAACCVSGRQQGVSSYCWCCPAPPVPSLPPSNSLLTNSFPASLLTACLVHLLKGTPCSICAVLEGCFLLRHQDQVAQLVMAEGRWLVGLLESVCSEGDAGVVTAACFTQCLPCALALRPSSRMFCGQTVLEHAWAAHAQVGGRAAVARDVVFTQLCLAA